MARHEIDNPFGLLKGLFGIGWVRTKCGMEVPSSNGPDYGSPVDCPQCSRGVKWNHHAEQR